ncbi:MAG: hypothetical protein ABIQ70_13545 [Dokdonella sp.]
MPANEPDLFLSSSFDSDNQATTDCGSGKLAAVARTTQIASPAASPVFPPASGHSPSTPYPVFDVKQANRASEPVANGASNLAPSMNSRVGG